MQRGSQKAIPERINISEPIDTFSQQSNGRDISQKNNGVKKKRRSQQFFSVGQNNAAMFPRCGVQN
jgi:hypothetical protein